jgi:hypothetical protein
MTTPEGLFGVLVVMTACCGIGLDVLNPLFGAVVSFSRKQCGVESIFCCVTFFLRT